MRQVSPIEVTEQLTDALNEFLIAPPEGTPAEVISAFKNALTEEGFVLPPRVFLAAVEQSPVAISIADPRATILYANPAFVRVTGYSVEEVVGRNESLLSNKATPVEVYREMWSTLMGRKPWFGVLVNRRKDGQPYLAELTVAPLVNAAGEITFFVGIHRDVTELHRLERHVHNQKALIESVVNSAPMAVALLDREGHVVLDNEAYKQLIVDLRSREPVRRLLAAVPGFTTPEELVASSRQRRGFSDVQVEFDPGRKAAPRWFSCSGTWVEEWDMRVDSYFETRRQEFLLFVATEVTALKRQQEKARRNAVRALMAEQQLRQGMRETLSGAIFQLQGPLNVAAAAEAMLARRGEEFEPMRAMLAELKNSGEQALERLRLAIPPEPPLARLPVNLNQVLRDVLAISTDRLLARGILVDWRPEAVLPPVLGEEPALRALFKHLIDNAVDAMGEPGSRGSELVVTTAGRGDVVEVLIDDSGPGIPPELRLRAFEPFFSGWQSEAEHVGMGLALAQNIVATHGGSIEFDAGHTEGCRVRVALPVQRGVSEPTDED